MTAEVPTLSIEDVNMSNNTSVLFDEVVAHRLGMIPLTFSQGKMNLPEECKCKGKGCPLCQAVLKLDKKGPGMAYSGDFKSSNKTVKATESKIPIVELLKGQAIKIEAIAKLGIGADHMKNQAANAAYQYYPELDASGVKDPKDLKAAAEACPRKVLSASGSKLTLKDPVSCDICRSCEEAADGLKIKGNNSKFIFRVESVSGLSPKEIVLKANEILQEKAKEFKKELSKV